jgi:hypothetical protein
LPARFTGDAKHAPAPQKPVQPASVAQLVPHTAPEHWYAPHDVGVPALHTPAPLQVDAVVTVALAHPAARQTVPAAHLRQAPAPSQKPSSPQVDVADAEQSLRGFVPGSASLHVPRLFVAPQV